MIHSLDTSTVRRISSGQVITKVEDVVKELIENSIDAESTSIEVKLVGDGLTSITVKDNGVGILECDRPAMALRNHTSKLYDFEGLSRVETYGFRGEALNSICSVTESTQITTKTENDPVAILYMLDHSGKILHAKSSGSSPGTTVTAIKLFSNVPVRRQVAKKISSSIGKNVQNLLITYALAHPHIRFSLKHTYENNSKLKFNEGNWIQPAMKNTMDAVIKLFGNELANEVQFGVWSSKSEDIENGGNDNNTEEQYIITLEAILPNPDAVPHIIFKNGKTFIYVNNRPVTTVRGEIKNLVSMVKSVYNVIACHNGWTGNTKTPFMWINIKLPTWVYDVNVEPNKNVALFHHGERLIEAVSNLLEMFYDLNNQREVQNTDINMEVDQPIEPMLDEDNINSNGNIFVEEMVMDSLDRMIQESCTPPSTSEFYNIRSSKRDNQVSSSPSHSESSYRHSQRVSGTTTPIHDREIDASRMKKISSNISNDIRHYVRKEIHPAKVDKSKLKMYDDDESRERHNFTKRSKRDQYNNSNYKDGNIDHWLKNCQTQNVEVPYTPTDLESQITSPVNHDEQGRNIRSSDVSRNNNTDSLSHSIFENSLMLRDGFNQSPSQDYNNRRKEDHLLTPPNDKSAAMQKESLDIQDMNNLYGHLHKNKGMQSENDSDLVDGLMDKRNSNERLVDDDIAEVMCKRPRIDDNIEGALVSEAPRNDLNEFEDRDFTEPSSLNKDKIIHSESEIEINSNQLHNDPIGSLSTLTNNQQLQGKENGVRTIAIGQPTIDDLIKSGAINLSPGQHLKKKPTNDNRLALSLTDVLDQELKLKFDKPRVLRRNRSTSKLNQIGYSLSYFNKLDYGMWVVTRKFNEKVVDIFIVHGERIRELVTLDTLITSTELNPTRKLLNPIDVTIEQLGSDRAIECLKRLTFDQIPDESVAGIWWNMITQKCLTANGVKVRWREDTGQIYIQLTHISPLVQFATVVEYFAHLMKHLCSLNMDSTEDIPFANTRSRLTMQILAREARQMVKHEDWTINKRDDEMKQRVKDATTYLMRRMQNFERNDPSVMEENEKDESTPIAMVERKNEEEIWYNDEVVVKILWSNIEGEY
ncbi:7788_t:CDS:10 [Funneliformis geosporum]|uniref:14621_t:CDS:1 n=1 Tax=Funneliformis geosporum TaxID=1117311 RepID=A0A9W4X1L4_9GLOM|nr:7788_t:CDS:10 [Funneliformis geosporum]CAI2179726.1 14621_t:CDS:10 [Funneliformis geosporum]